MIAENVVKTKTDTMTERHRSSELVRRHRKLIAGAYWVFVTLVYIVGLYDRNNEGGIPSVIVTLPWSVVVLGIGASLDSIPLFHPMFNALATTFGNFLMLPFLCGGLNAAIIYGLLSLGIGRRGAP